MISCSIKMEVAMALSFFDKIKKTVSDVVDTVSNTAASITNSVSDLFADTSKMSWEDRVTYYQKLETVEGYVKALHLSDFQEPGDYKLADIWANAINKHPEMAPEIYRQANNLVTSSTEMWRHLLDVHVKALEKSPLEYENGIDSVISLIRCIKLREHETVKARQGLPKDAIEKFALATKGDWETLENIIKSDLKKQFSDPRIICTKSANSLANYAQSVGDYDRAIEIIHHALIKLGTSNNLSLEWRLAILYRDLEKWDKYADLLASAIVNNTDPLEEKLDIYRALIQIYRDILRQDEKLPPMYEKLLELNPSCDEATTYLLTYYEQHSQWNEYIRILKLHADTSETKTKADAYLRIALIYLEQLSESMVAVEFFEKAFNLDPQTDKAYDYLKDFYIKERKWEKLVSLQKKWAETLQIDNSKIEPYTCIAETSLFKLSNKSDAIEYFEKVLSINPKNTNAIEHLKKIYTDNDDIEGLINVQQKEALLITDVDEKINRLKSLVLLARTKANNGGLAIKLLNIILECRPSDKDALEALNLFIPKEETNDEYKSDTVSKSNDDSASTREPDPNSATDASKPEAPNVIPASEEESAFIKGLKTISGVRAYQERKRSINNKAEADKIKQDVERETNYRRAQLNGILEFFGQYRLTTLHYTIGRFLHCLERLNKNSKDKEYDFLKAIDIQQEEVAEMKQIDMKASDAMKTLAIGGGFATIGAIGTPVLVTNAVMALGAASTGTAISTLSGAAAQSAVLAWLGGGSLAAGGGGMAAGAAVLTGIATAAAVVPAMISVGILSSSFYSKKNTESEQYLAEVCIWAANVRQGWAVLDGVRKRISELHTITHDLEIRAVTMLDHLESIIDTFDKTNLDHVKLLQQNTLIAKSMSELSQTPILNKDGNVNDAIDIVVAQTEKVLNKDL